MYLYIPIKGISLLYQINNKMTNLKDRLKKGETIIFDNEMFCEENKSDDFRSAECDYYQYNKSFNFLIKFNGAFYNYKTFQGFQNKLNQLISDFNLTFNEINTNEINA